MASKARESKQVEKVRNKLKEQMSIADKQVTQEALLKARHEIEAWINRHSSERLNLKDKSFRLFDENKHPAKAKSSYVKHLLQFLKAHEGEPKKSLMGRIKPL